jgi:ribosomal protein S18 acetylase RimI-like enzyme
LSAGDTIASVLIRPATLQDAEAIWQIFQPVVAGRDTYAFAPNTSREIGVGYWFGPQTASFVAEVDGVVAGVCKLIDNRQDLGSHVANASFMVAPSAAGRGVGRAMGLHCLREARLRGYEAMQFNFVVSTNQRAVALWQSLGFQIVGTLPRAFRHGTLGLVDAYVMYRDLDDIVLSFGTTPDSDTPRVTACVYAVIDNPSGEIAMVENEHGRLLPGGECQNGEPFETTLSRAVQNACGFDVKLGRSLGNAIQFARNVATGQALERRSHFLMGKAIASAPKLHEYRVNWWTADRAMATIDCESHAWAIKRWIRLNT